MKIRDIYYSKHFKKKLQRYIHLKRKIISRIELFKADPFNERLKTHKLANKLDQYWSFSVDYHIRILFEFIDKETVGFIDIGTHAIYK